MTNPAGFANVRAHAEAHLRAMAPPAPVMTPGMLLHAAAHVRPPQAALSPRGSPSALQTTSASAVSRAPENILHALTSATAQATTGSPSTATMF
jgi:hypothetical protein